MEVPSMKWIVLMIAFGLGCARNQVVTLPGGLKANVAKCDATMINCYKVADRVCQGQGYYIVERNDMQQATGSGFAYGGIGGAGFEAKGIVSMFFNCGQKPETPAQAH
jgi:hypothetical protein